MKLKINPKLKKGILFLQLLSIIAGTNTALSNSEVIEDQFSGEIPIDIDGSFNRPSESDKLEQMRKKLEKQNEEMVQKKIEDIRVNNEKKLTEQLQSALSGQAPLGTDSVSSLETTTEKKSDNTEKIIDVNINVGVSNINSSALDLETSLSGKISAESRINKKLSLGLGVGYTSVKMTPINDFYGNSFVSPYYGSGYYNVNAAYGRQVSYEQLDVSANSKMIFGNSSKLNPYIGFGLLYSRFNMSYDANFYQATGLNQNNGINGGFLSLNANIGTRLMLSEMLGINLELGYTRGIGGVLGGNNYSLLNPDHRVLRNLANEISESNIFGIQGGLLLSF